MATNHAALPSERGSADWTAEIGAWGLQTFGPYRIHPGLVHLERELTELKRASTVQEAQEEAADMVILLCYLAALWGFDLTEAVRAKMVVNRRRRWGAPDAEGVIEHVR